MTRFDYIGHKVSLEVVIAVKGPIAQGGLEPGTDQFRYKKDYYTI